MKKTYTKPEMSFESFELSTSVASSCPGGGVNVAEYQCAITDPGGDNVFIDVTYGCTPQFNSYALEENPCYHNSSDNNNTFSS